MKELIEWEWSVGGVKIVHQKLCRRVHLSGLVHLVKGFINEPFPKPGLVLTVL